jgi:Raf kinase inhibitor-like YbhB/YbcL family protein
MMRIFTYVLRVRLLLRKASVQMLAIAACLVVFQSGGAEGAGMDRLVLSSPAFSGNQLMPSKYTCDGANVSPPLLIAHVPDGTKSLALIVDDPDAPAGTWVHWVLWNLDPATAEIGEDSVPAAARQGTNDFRKRGYGGPCPPSGTHRYFFKLYALDGILDLGPDATKAVLERAMQGHVVARVELIGLYKRR